MDTDLWIVIQTDKLSQIIGKTFLGLSTSQNDAKQLAQESAKDYFSEYHIAEIDGFWCVEGLVEASNQMGYIGIYKFIKKV